MTRDNCPELPPTVAGKDERLSCFGRRFEAAAFRVVQWLEKDEFPYAKLRDMTEVYSYQVAMQLLTYQHVEGVGDKVKKLPHSRYTDLLRRDFCECRQTDPTQQADSDCETTLCQEMLGIHRYPTAFMVGPYSMSDPTLDNFAIPSSGLEPLLVTTPPEDPGPLLGCEDGYWFQLFEPEQKKKAGKKKAPRSYRDMIHEEDWNLLPR